MLEEKKQVISSVAESSQFFLTFTVLLIYISKGTIFAPSNIDYWVLVLSFFLFIHTAFLIYIRASIYTSNLVWIFFLGAFTLYSVERLKLGAFGQYPEYFYPQILCTFIIIFGLSQCVKKKQMLVSFFSLILLFLFFQVFYGLHQKYFSLPDLLAKSQKPEFVKAYFSGLTSDTLFMQRLNAQLPYGSVTYPNAWAFLLGGLFLIITFIFIESYKLKQLKSKLFYVATLIPLLWALCVSDAKGVWICCTGFLGLVVFVQMPFVQRLGRSKKIGLGLLGLVGLLLVFNFMIWPMLSFQVRWNYWLAGWHMYVDQAQYLFGLGSSEFGMLYSQYKTPEGWEVQKPHNYFLYLLVEQGILGFSLFVLVLVAAFFVLLKKRTKPEEAVMPLKIPDNLYAFVYYTSFFVYCFVLPMLMEDVYASSVINLFLAFYLIIVGLCRFLKHKKIQKKMSFENNVFVQLFLFLALAISFVYSWLPVILGQDSWVYTEKSQNFFPPLIEGFIYLLSFSLLLWFLQQFKSKEQKGVSAINSTLLEKLVSNRVYALALFLYIIIELLTDMIGHFQAIPVISMACFILYNAYKGEQVLELPKIWNGLIYFALLSSSLYIFMFMVKPAHTFYGDFKEFEVVRTSKGQKLSKMMFVSNLVKKYPKNPTFQFYFGDLLHELSTHYKNEGKAMMEMEYLQNAVDHWSAVAKNFPQLARPHFEMAELFVENNSLESSLGMYKKAISLYPLKGQYHLSLANAYLKLGDKENAIISYEEVLRIQKLSDKRTRISKEEYDKVVKTVLDLKRKYDNN